MRLALSLALLAALAAPAGAETAAARTAFPAGFLWGAATAAHQVEGGGDNDWTEAERTRPGFIKTQESAAVAIDHWRRYDADFALAKGMGHNAHRMSIEWSRIEPAEGQRDWAAVDHYHQVFASMKRHGLTPMVTLHHFTSPRWVAAQGGWLDARTVAAFERFAAFCGREYGAEVDLWCTVNEPNVYAFYAYDAGSWPPFHQDREETLRAIANLARGHAAAYHALHTADHADADGDGQAAAVGFAQHLAVFEPLNPANPLDLVRTAITERIFDRAPLQAMTRGEYRFTLPGHTGVWADEPRSRGATDFIGVNYYTRWLIDSQGDRSAPKDATLTGMGWEDYPEGMTKALQMANEYAALPDGRRVPIYVTENGIDDRTGNRRGSYLVRHVQAVADAIAAGVDVRGYLHWTLTDNFEWTEGYAPRFGLYRIDRTPQGDLARIPTEGVAVFRELTAAHGLTQGLLLRYGR